MSSGSTQRLRAQREERECGVEVAAEWKEAFSRHARRRGKGRIDIELYEWARKRAGSCVDRHDLILRQLACNSFHTPKQPSTSPQRASLKTTDSRNHA